MNQEQYLHLYSLALKIATEAHSNQLDDSGKPYILHPIHVAENCEHRGAKIIALLHDVIEDTTVTTSDLIREFPEWVVYGVEAITHREGETLKNYLERVSHNPYAKEAKMADIQHNMSWDRIKDLPVERQIRLVAKGIRSLHYLRFEEWYETPELKTVLKQGQKPKSTKAE